MGFFLVFFSGGGYWGWVQCIFVEAARMRFGWDKVLGVWEVWTAVADGFQVDISIYSTEFELICTSLEQPVRVRVPCCFVIVLAGVYILGLLVVREHCFFASKANLTSLARLASFV